MNASGELRDLEQFLHAKIPITRAMGVRVVPHPTKTFALESSVAINRNHVGTAFGGSINSVATLAGYGWLWLQLRELKAQAVVQQSSISFLRPIHETIRATCEPIPAAELRAFLETIRTKGKARLSLSVTTEEKGEITAVFSGTFVASNRPADERDQTVDLQPTSGAGSNV